MVSEQTLIAPEGRPIRPRPFTSVLTKPFDALRTMNETMESDELLESAEHAHSAVQRSVGVTLALFAACLAVVTLMGHRLHTEEVVLQTQTADGWAYYQAKNTRSQMYAADAKLAELQGAQGITLAATWVEKANQEKQQADDIRHSTEDLVRETQTAARRATMFDAAEVFVEIAMVLCSVSLLTSASVFWRVSFVSTGVGLALAALGFLKR